jgi:betaine-aldehyde dehydrogenase
MLPTDRIYINGAWVASTGSGTIPVINPATEEVIATVPDGTAEDADRAVQAAAAAFEAWSQTPLEDRIAYVTAIADGLDARTQEIAETVTAELGMPISRSKGAQARLPIGQVRAAIKAAQSFPFEERVRGSVVVREPVGVVAAITPWNYPLNQIAIKVAPALLGGNTVVLKPSEVTPLNAYILAEVVQAAGLPAGVFNMVTGQGPVVGEALASHPKVDMVSLTGSTRAGQRVTELASKTIKKVHLELGGKSANIILDDANLEQAVTSGVNECYPNSGQTCSALTRMLVPREQYEEAIAIARRAAEAVKVGDPTDPSVQLGPLVSATQRDRVRSYIEKGIAEGATVVLGGPEAPEGLERGYYVRPTIFANARNDMTIAQEEIFGPVLTIIPHDGDDDAVRIANDSIYGLSGGVWSGSEERAMRVARRIRTGQVSINGGGGSLESPFGGYKQSGNGREWGAYGLDEFLETKALNVRAD